MFDKYEKAPLSEIGEKKMSELVDKSVLGIQDKKVFITGILEKETEQSLALFGTLVRGFVPKVEGRGFADKKSMEQYIHCFQFEFYYKVLYVEKFNGSFVYI